MMIEPDTYFFSPQEALRVAAEQNRSDDLLQYELQVCYYDGEKIDSDLVNLIHLPIDKLLDKLSTGTKRIPTHINFVGLDISLEVANEIENNLLQTFRQARGLRRKLNEAYVDGARLLQINFDEPLRFYLKANSRTRVMQFVTKDIVEELERKGYEVHFELLQGIEDIHNIKSFYEFNPHIVISLNHFDNMYLSPDVFHFAWFQDPMPIVTNEAPIFHRKRDYIFTYQTFVKNNLLKKGIPKDKIFEQKVIPANTASFYLNDNINKENKVVFVGSFYQNQYTNYIDEGIEKKIYQLLQEGKSLNIENLEGIFTSFLTSLPDSDLLINYIQQAFIRNISVEWLCESYENVEIYGYGWEDNTTVKPYFKGKAEKNELNHLYNSAKYVLAASGNVINTQRLGEIVHAGAIPLIYDSRDITDEDETWDDECLYFKTQDELRYILENNIEPKKYRTEKMLDYFTYKSFLNTIFTTVKENR